MFRFDLLLRSCLLENGVVEGICTMSFKIHDNLECLIQSACITTSRSTMCIAQVLDELQCHSCLYVLMLFKFKMEVTKVFQKKNGCRALFPFIPESTLQLGPKPSCRGRRFSKVIVT